MESESNRKKSRESEFNDQAMFIGIGMSLGAGIGTAIGAAIGNIGIGVGIGSGIGLMIGIIVFQLKTAQNSKSDRHENTDS